MEQTTSHRAAVVTILLLAAAGGAVRWEPSAAPISAGEQTVGEDAKDGAAAGKRNVPARRGERDRRSAAGETGRMAPSPRPHRDDQTGEGREQGRREKGNDSERERELIRELERLVQ